MQLLSCSTCLKSQDIQAVRSPVLVKGKHQTHFKGIKEQGPGNTWPISLTSVPWKILLEAISRHMDGREVIKDSWYGFTKDKSHLLTWRPWMTEWLHWWIRKIHLMPCTLTPGPWHGPTQHLVSKLERDGFDGCTAWWTRNWLDGQRISQWLSVQKDISNKWRPSGPCTQADTVHPSLMAQTEHPLSTKLNDGCHPEWPWDRPGEQAHEHLMKFNTAECGVLHLSRGTPCYWCTLGEEWNGSPEKDLGN